MVRGQNRGQMVIEEINIRSVTTSVERMKIMLVDIRSLFRSILVFLILHHSIILIYVICAS